MYRSCGRLGTDDALNQVSETGAIDARGVQIDDQLLEQILVAAPSAKNGKALFRNARFDDATFTGVANFVEATFTSGTVFSGATFAGGAEFSGATFSGGAVFSGATFSTGLGSAEQPSPVAALHRGNLLPRCRVWRINFLWRC